MTNEDNGYWGNPPQTPLSKSDTDALQATQQNASTPHIPAEEPVTQAIPIPQDGVAQVPAGQTQPVQTPLEQPTAAQVPVEAPTATPTVPPQAPPVQQTGTQVASPQPAPVQAQPVQGVPVAAAPTAPRPKKKYTWLIIIIVVIICLCGIGGCSMGMLASTVANNDKVESFMTDNLGTDVNSPAKSSATYSYLKQNASAAGSVSGDSVATAGLYVVGKDIKAGTYWIEGNDTTATTFDVWKPQGSATTTPADADLYDPSVDFSFFGHCILTLSEGDIIDSAALKMYPIEQMTNTFTDPYTNGVFRVGTDLPAGTYTVAAGSASTYSAYFVYSDTVYTSQDAIISEDIVVPNETTTVTLKEGQIVELYNATMSTDPKAAAMTGGKSV